MFKKTILIFFSLILILSCGKKDDPVYKTSEKPTMIVINIHI